MSSNSFYDAQSTFSPSASLLGSEPPLGSSGGPYQQLGSDMTCGGLLPIPPRYSFRFRCKALELVLVHGVTPLLPQANGSKALPQRGHPHTSVKLDEVLITSESLPDRDRHKSEVAVKLTRMLVADCGTRNGGTAFKAVAEVTERLPTRVGCC